MHRFERRLPIDLTPYPDPGVEAARSGPPLSQGVILTLVNTVGGEHLSEETQDILDSVEPEVWYLGQTLESVISELEEQDPSLPYGIGKNIYYTLRAQFVALGINSPTDVINTLPLVWSLVTRGDSGEWRNQVPEPGHGRLELDQPYHCGFESGALHGAMEAFGAYDVLIDHSQCVRQGAPFCVLDVTWKEA